MSENEKTEYTRMECRKCGKVKPLTDFYKKKTGERITLCSDCLTEHADCYEPDTFMWILKEFDVPYIKKNWISLANKTYLKDPAKFSHKSVIGKYLRAMNMIQYKDYGFADSDWLNDEEEKKVKHAPIVDIQEVEKRLQEQLDKGEINKSQYDTLSAEVAPKPPLVLQKPKGLVAKEEMVSNEDRIRQAMTDEEYQYLLLKWGHMYQPSQLIQMERLYTKYADEYELNVDREETLKNICKTFLKMDEALDVGDIQTYQKLASVSDQLRKSGKFTEAQNREEQKRYLDSIGELVALCEREGGPIKEFVDPDEYPQDKIDFTLKDFKSYNYNLAVNELNLGDLIESYIEKLEKAEKDDNKDLSAGLVTSSDEEHEQVISDGEAMEFQDYLENEIEKDAMMLIESFGGDAD